LTPITLSPRCLTPSRRLFGAAALLIAPGLSAQVPHHHPPEGSARLGSVAFSTSCRPAAQREFLRGLALQHSFWYEEAAKGFRAAAAADSSCAMAYWGLAMSYFHPLWWQREAGLGLEEGQAAAARAAAIGAPTRRERDYIAAVGAYYRDYQTADPRARIRAYSDSMAEVHQRNPRDPEAAVFYALALVASAPPGDTSLSNQKRADVILDSLYAKYPNHPGLAHYLIHANDSPQLAALGLNAARRYARIAPAVPHALHMPSHIFLRLGLWDEAIASNERATAEGRRYQTEQQMAGTWFHNLHTLEFLETGYLQEGRDGEALKIVKEVAAVTEITPSTPLGAARWLAVIPLRYALERGDWREAAALQLHPVPESGPGTALAATRFGRALGAARSGDTTAARAELLQLASILASLRERKKPEDAEYVETLRQAAAAWFAIAMGDTAGALGLAESAADRQDMTVEAPYLFARELEGELLLQIGRPMDALRTFEAALKLVPNRGRSLFGAATAAQQAGDTATARRRYQEYVALMAKGDGQRPELQAAQRFLASR
jgi:hypothetical protein